jgi:3-mercaptopropionate dioxygenase
MTTTLTTTSALVELATDVDRAARRHRSAKRTLGAVEAALAPYLGLADLLTPEQREPDPTAYRQHLLHVAPDGAFSIVALVWLPGQATPVHDHISWCVVGVHEGEEHETQFRVAGGRLIPIATAVNAVRSVSGVLPPGDIHLVRNSGDCLAISLHVYGADLRVSGTSIRRRYDLPVVPS